MKKYFNLFLKNFKIFLKTKVLEKEIKVFMNEGRSAPVTAADLYALRANMG